MLDNDPPPGTEVRLVRRVRKADRTLEAYETAKLIGPTRTYLKETAADEFAINYRGERVIVQRQDIEKVKEGSQ